jgi:MSHA biogenesis protein MshI
MRLFRKPKKTEGWLAMVPQRDGIAAAGVKSTAGARPRVEVAQFFPGTADAELLDKAARDLPTGSSDCTTLLAQGEYQLLSVEAPNVPPAELKTAMRWRLKDMLDYPVLEATIDVLAVPLDPNAVVRPQQSVFAVAARNSVIGPRQQMFRAARVPLRAIDIPEMAQRNVSALLEPEGRGLALLSFGDDGGLLTVTWRAELYLARRLDVTLAQVRDADPERRNASFDKIALELQRTLDNFERQFSFISVAKLVLAPTAAPGLEEYLASNLYTRVETLDLGTVVDLHKVAELADPVQQQRYFLPIGAALRVETAAA